MALFKHNKVDTLLGWFHTFGEQCMWMYVCVWVGIWKYLFFYCCSISFVTHVVPMKHNVITHTNSDCGVTVLPVSAWFMLLSFFTGILKSYFSQYVITLLLQCLWRILADKLHKNYSQVRVIKSIASKCRYFHLKWKLFLKSIPVGFIYDIYIYSQWTC